jgi:hypothetical protein
LEFEAHLHYLIFLQIFCTSIPYQASSILLVHAILTNIGRNHISLRNFIHCLPSPATFSLQQSPSCHPPSMSLNRKYSNICRIHIKSCVLHAKSHVSLHSYYGSTCQRMTPVIPCSLTLTTQEHYLQSYAL